MLKKLKKTLTKEFAKRYDQLEERYLNIENKVYSTLEDRLASLEQKFDELSDLLIEEIRTRRQQNEEKQAQKSSDSASSDNEDGFDFSEKVAEAKKAVANRIKDIKEDIEDKVEDIKEDVEEQVEKVSKKIAKGVKKAKNKAKKGSKEVKKKVEEVVQEANDDLTAINGLGEKFAEKLKAEGVTSFEQMASLTKQQVQALDAKIKSFAARYERYEWGKQARDLNK